MKVKITKFGLDLDVKNKGMELAVYSPDGTDRLGDLKVTKTGLTWSNGKEAKGTKATWKQFIDWMNSDA